MSLRRFCCSGSLLGKKIDTAFEGATSPASIFRTFKMAVPAPAGPAVHAAAATAR